MDVPYRKNIVIPCFRCGSVTHLQLHPMRFLFTCKSDSRNLHLLYSFYCDSFCFCFVFFLSGSGLSALFSLDFPCNSVQTDGETLAVKPEPSLKQNIQIHFAVHLLPANPFWFLFPLQSPWHSKVESVHFKCNLKGKIKNSKEFLILHSLILTLYTTRNAQMFPTVNVDMGFFCGFMCETACEWC